ncbi:MAG: hypothetical protein H6713_23590 [Myxococcales bacterium]|nr:hypothetical protein [Myxococcales bacterium]MCB9752949.1 hypothetical protein [Myxococcales bacterium]
MRAAISSLTLAAALTLAGSTACTPRYEPRPERDAPERRSTKPKPPERWTVVVVDDEPERLDNAVQRRGVLTLDPMPLHADGESARLRLLGDDHGSVWPLEEPIPIPLHPFAGHEVEVRGRRIDAPGRTAPRLRVHEIRLAAYERPGSPIPWKRVPVRSSAELRRDTLSRLLVIPVSIEPSSAAAAIVRTRLDDGAVVELVVNSARRELYERRLGTRVTLIATLGPTGGRLRPELHGACDGDEPQCGISVPAFDVVRRE